VTVNWPSHVTVVQPAQFSKVANEIASLFALASTSLKSDPGARAMKNDSCGRFRDASEQTREEADEWASRGAKIVRTTAR
jgi:hypothetical protein